uniref:Uncharacterized protein n=1 Tax=Romanomermis culicivorax TaxID=13658 RepID=A0A915HXF2_ROMCU
MFNFDLASEINWIRLRLAKISFLSLSNGSLGTGSRGCGAAGCIGNDARTPGVSATGCLIVCVPDAVSLDSSALGCDGGRLTGGTVCDIGGHA